MNVGVLRRVAFAVFLMFMFIASPLGDAALAQAQPMRLAILPFDIPFFYLNASALSANVTDMAEEAMNWHWSSPSRS